MFWNKKSTTEPATGMDQLQIGRMVDAIVNKFAADLHSGAITVQQARKHQFNLPESLQEDIFIHNYLNVQRNTVIQRYLATQARAAATQVAAAELAAAGLSPDQIAEILQDKK